MPTIRVKNPQTAQGMLEFALVLPILLLIIFGVFAFGHLFFSYSSVVSASREAARWGSAAGVSESLRPRYSDCDSIRAAAVRVGKFAGVAPVDSPDDVTPGVAISFDHGPNDPDPAFDDCSDGLGAGVVGYGDRINVRVTVEYRPIVPLVSIPTFPLTATTSRTIIKSLPVGDAAAVAASCPTTTLILEVLPLPIADNLYGMPEVNQPMDVRVRVIASNGKSPTGVVDIVDYDPNDPTDIHTCSVSATSYAAGRICTGFALNGYETAGTKYLTALYDNRGTCFQPSELINQPFDVDESDTTVVITSDDPDPSWPYNPDYPHDLHDVVVVGFSVSPQFPAGPNFLAKPNGGTVTITDQFGHSWTSSPILNGVGQVDNVLLERSTDLYATYNGDWDANFRSSPRSAPEPHTIRVAATRTATPTETPIAGPTFTPTPTQYACPYLTGIMDEIDNYALAEISNMNGIDTALESIYIDWPVTPEARLVDIRFGDLTTLNVCGIGETADGAINCLWQAADPLNGLYPPPQTISSTTPNWFSPAAALASGTSKYIRITFSIAPPTGTYSYAFRFQNGCVLEGTGYNQP